MSKMLSLTCFLSLIGLSLAIAGCPMQTADQPMTFNVTLSGGAEVPAATGTGSGTGTVTLSADRTKLDYQFTASGLTGAVTAAHFHNAATGVAGSVIFGIGDTVSETNGQVSASGTWVFDTTNDVDEAAEILAGNIYINFHTAENPPGELRGQIQ